jgi:hypothetical protein
MATMLGQENRNKTGKIGPVNNGLGAAGAFMNKNPIKACGQAFPV